MDTIVLVFYTGSVKPVKTALDSYCRVPNKYVTYLREEYKAHLRATKQKIRINIPSGHKAIALYHDGDTTDLECLGIIAALKGFEIRTIKVDMTQTSVWDDMIVQSKRDRKLSDLKHTKYRMEYALGQASGCFSADLLKPLYDELAKIELKLKHF